MTQALSFPTISAVGNIDAYIQAASRYPMLSETEEIRLAERFHNDGDVEAARQLVLSHLRLVISTCFGLGSVVCQLTIFVICHVIKVNRVHAD